MRICYASHMANKRDYKPLSPFAKAFAIEYKGWASGHNITLKQIADRLGRTLPYTSERANGKRALDTMDVDALAGLTGITGRDLMIELAKRTKETLRKKTDEKTARAETRVENTLKKIQRNDVSLAASTDPNKEKEMEGGDGR